jgi:hypothetical protein
MPTSSNTQGILADATGVIRVGEACQHSAAPFWRRQINNKDRLLNAKAHGKCETINIAQFCMNK